VPPQEGHRAAARLAVQDAATHALAESASLEEAAPRALQSLGAYLDWQLGAMWVVDRETQRLSCLEVWSAEGIDAVQFERLARATTFAEGSGIPGRAWHERGAVWVSDVASMARSDRVRNTAQLGLHTAFAFPIVMAGDVVGAIEFFSTDVREPDQHRLALLASVGAQLGQYIERERARGAARRSQAMTEAVLHGASDCIVTITSEGRIMEWNPAAEAAFGRTREQAIGTSFFDLTLIPEEGGADMLGLACSTEDVEDRVVGSRLEVTALRHDGSQFPAELTLTPVGTEGPAAFTIYLRDISRRVEVRRTLLLHDRALAAAHSGIVILDALAQGMPSVYVNAAFERITGYPADDFVGDSIAVLQGADTDQATVEEVKRAIAEGREHEATLINYRKDGTPFWNEVSISPVVSDGLTTHWVAVMSDITARRQAEERVLHLSYHDGVTGLPNRLMFTEHLELALARAARQGLVVAVLLVDINGFKLVNDSFGLAAGDELLRQAADRLRRVTRAADVVARQSGDEFLILIADLEPTTDGRGDAALGDALQIAQAIGGQIKMALEAPFEIDGIELFVGVTVGQSLCPRDALDVDGLIREAGASVDRSRSGRGGGEPETSVVPADARKQLSLSSRLRRALERDEFVLHYQPVLDLRSDMMIGTEALIRWSDPQRGLLPPSEFIPLAERIGMIGPLSDWVMDAAISQARQWHTEGIDIDVAINLPPVLWQIELVPKLRAAVQRHGLDPRKLMIEVTETAAMTDPDRTQRVLHELSELGVQLAIDDFGTGYSSLSRLKQMHVSTLKIDRSFVRDLPEDQDAASIVLTIIQLARNLGIQPLAEGIETLAQREFLVANGCLQGQGYHFARPLPAEEIPAAFARLSRRADAA
jgi:diguanylate cyclase (GGDEF)-like protein/PAS domain S-box-containing protein